MNPVSAFGPNRVLIRIRRLVNGAFDYAVCACTPLAMCVHTSYALVLISSGPFPPQPAADIVLSPPPIQPRALSLHPAAIAHLRAKIAEGCLAGVKLDPNPPLTERYPIHLPRVDKTSFSTIASKVRLLNVYPSSCTNTTCYCRREA